MNNSRLANKKDDKTTKFPSLKTRLFYYPILNQYPKDGELEDQTISEWELLKRGRPGGIPCY